jgi:adenosine kinase
MEPRILISGSLAYDIITVFPDRFARHLLPDQMHRLSVSFTVNNLRREWGGCAGNIAYTLKKLGGEPVLLATLGAEDDKPYQLRLSNLKINRDGVKSINGAFTAQATIMTDLDDNQITAFYPGAMNEAHRINVTDVTNIALGIVSPNGKEGMLLHAKQFYEQGTPFVLDLGQGMTLFSANELMEMLSYAKVVALNDYELNLLCERATLSFEQLRQTVPVLIVTYGAGGSKIHINDETLEIAAVKPDAEVDPTGCGDAYRAGILYGMAHNWDWRKTGQLASLLGSLKMASRGAQNHSINRDDLSKRYFDAYKQELVWD